MGTMYGAVGVHPALDAAVQRFQQRVTADSELAWHFNGMDMPRILAHQMTLLGLFFGSPPRDNGSAK
jgi:truncated hemoglobin YjbI